MTEPKLRASTAARDHRGIGGVDMKPQFTQETGANSTASSRQDLVNVRPVSQKLAHIIHCANSVLSESDTDVVIDLTPLQQDHSLARDTISALAINIIRGNALGGQSLLIAFDRNDLAVCTKTPQSITAQTKEISQFTQHMTTAAWNIKKIVLFFESWLQDQLKEQLGERPGADLFKKIERRIDEPVLPKISAPARLNIV